MSENSDWRPIRKFPGYEVSVDMVIRSTLTKRIIPKRLTSGGAMVLIQRNGWNTECFVLEMYLHAFPEKRAMVAMATRSAA